jgi:hypothetical protein
LCSGVRFSGVVVIMIYRIISGDLVRFFLIYGIFIIGYSQGRGMRRCSGQRCSVLLDIQQLLARHARSARLGRRQNHILQRARYVQ